MNKICGVVVDNYKVKKLKKELDKAEFTNYTETKFTSETTIIKVIVPKDKVNDVYKIVKLLEINFKLRN